MAELRTKATRLYATTTASKLWIKEIGNPPTQVATKRCVNVDDFIKKAKVELNTHCQLTLHTSIDGTPLRPGLKLSQIAAKNNSDESPLIIKIVPPTQHSALRKTIFVREIDDDGDFTENYMEYEIKSDAELAQIIKNGEGLTHLSEPRKAIVGFDQLKCGEKYQLYKYGQPFGDGRK